MKKLLVALLLVAALFACGGEKQQTPDAESVTLKGSFQSEVDEDGNYNTCDVTLVDGKITEVTFDTFYASKNDFKKALKEDYGMKGASPIGKEWYEQMEAFEAYCVGKTPEEVAATPLKTVGDHDSVADVADLETSCTINVGDYIEALAGAVAAAK